MGGMSKTFREWSPEQNVMFPPSALGLVAKGQCYGNIFADLRLVFKIGSS